MNLIRNKFYDKNIDFQESSWWNKTSIISLSLFWTGKLSIWFNGQAKMGLPKFGVVREIVAVWGALLGYTSGLNLAADPGPVLALFISWKCVNSHYWSWQKCNL